MHKHTALPNPPKTHYFGNVNDSKQWGTKQNMSNYVCSKQTMAAVYPKTTLLGRGIYPNELNKIYLPVTWVFQYRYIASIYSPV